jgi:hypothetical protein
MNISSKSLPLLIRCDCPEANPVPFGGNDLFIPLGGADAERFF